MAAVCVHAHGGALTLARFVPAEFQRVLWPGILRGCIFFTADEVVAAAWNLAGHRHLFELLLSSEGLERFRFARSQVPVVQLCRFWIFDLVGKENRPESLLHTASRWRNSWRDSFLSDYEHGVMAL